MESSFLNPSRIVESLHLEEGMKVAEFGSGTGMFSLAIAEKLGAEGKVYALDVQKETLEALRAKARAEGVFNIEIVWADLEREGSTKIPDEALDMVFLPNVLFQSQKKAEILKEAHRITKPGGTVVVIDWLPKKAIFGASMGWLETPEKMQGIAEGIGLTFVDVLQTGSAYHYGLLFRK
ncbi:MAG: class I SAM-dependent methyltransferase [bacterium]|nr:class I SAM-dependent methyltransferase [bacterium]